MFPLQSVIIPSLCDDDDRKNIQILLVYHSAEMSVMIMKVHPGGKMDDEMGDEIITSDPRER